MKLDLILVLFVFVLFLLTFIKKENFENQNSTTNSSTTGECGRSLVEIQTLLDAQKKEDQEAYNKSLEEWNKKKKQFEDKIGNDPKLWPTVCSDEFCEVDDYVVPMAGNGNPKSNNLGASQNIGSIDLQACKLALVKNPGASYAIYNGNCYFVWPDYPQYPFYEYYKTPTGMRKSTTIGLTDGNKLYVNPTTWTSKNEAQCKEYCMKDNGCLVGIWNPTTSQCAIGGYLPGWAGLVRQVKPKVTMEDSNPQLVKYIGAKPEFKRTPVEIGSIICQDCRQFLDKTSVTDSKDVNMSQLNTCIANSNRNQSSAITPNQNIQPSNQPSTNQLPAESDNKTKYWVIGGGVSLCLIIAVLIGIIIFKSKSE